MDQTGFDPDFALVTTADELALAPARFGIYTNVPKETPAMVLRVCLVLSIVLTLSTLSRADVTLTFFG